MSDSPSTKMHHLTSPDTGRSGQIPQIVMYTTPWCGDCRQAKRVFAALGVPVHEIDLQQHPEAAQRVREVNHGMQRVPTIVFPDDTVLVEPGARELEAKLRQLV
jgi:mycoredoxin